MTAPRPEAVELADAISDHFVGYVDDQRCERVALLIEAALTAARADERERACKAVCPWCSMSLNVFKHGSQWKHSASNWESTENCKASAIRAMEGR